MDDARARLEAERAEKSRLLAGLTGEFDGVVAASRDSNADDEHDPEGATIAFERSQLGTVVAQVTGHLAEIDAALARQSAGSYGVCERCGAQIAHPRLRARPAARLCIRCASDVGR